MFETKRFEGRLVEVGKVGRPHGFRGSFVVQVSSGSRSALAYLSEIHIGSSPEVATLFHIVDSSWMPKGWKVTVREVGSDTDAKLLTGKLVYAPREALETPEDGEYYLDDLTQSEVIDFDTKVVIGTFVGMEPRETFGGNHDRWWIRVGNDTITVPATKDFIVEVSAKEKKIIIRNWRSLLED